MSRTGRLTAVFCWEHRSNVILAVLPAFSIAILFVSSVPITALTVTVAVAFPVAFPIAVTSLSLAFWVSLAFSTVLAVAFSIPVAIPAALTVAFRAFTAVLASLRSIRVPTTAFALKTPIVRTVHFTPAVHESFAARTALRARVPGARSCGWRLGPHTRLTTTTRLDDNDSCVCLFITPAYGLPGSFTEFLCRRSLAGCDWGWHWQSVRSRHAFFYASVAPWRMRRLFRWREVRDDGIWKGRGAFSALK